MQTLEEYFSDDNTEVCLGQEFTYNDKTYILIMKTNGTPAPDRFALISKKSYIMVTDFVPIDKRAPTLGDLKKAFEMNLCTTKSTKLLPFGKHVIINNKPYILTRIINDELYSAILVNNNTGEAGAKIIRPKNITGLTRDEMSYLCDLSHTSV